MVVSDVNGRTIKLYIRVKYDRNSIFFHHRYSPKDTSSKSSSATGYLDGGADDAIDPDMCEISYFIS